MEFEGNRMEGFIGFIVAVEVLIYFIKTNNFLSFFFLFFVIHFLLGKNKYKSRDMFN